MSVASLPDPRTALRLVDERSTEDPLATLERLLASSDTPEALRGDLERVAARLRRQGDTLALLDEVGRELTSILDRSQLLERIAERVKGLIDYQVFNVMLWNPSIEMLEPAFARSCDELDSRVPKLRRGEGVSGTAFDLGEAVRIGDVREDPRYLSCGDERVLSELALPLFHQGVALGVLNLESYSTDAFSAEHEAVLHILSSSIAVALANAALFERTRDGERRLDADLQTARETQRMLLPRSSPWLPGVQTAVAYRPARHLGGDLYDFLAAGESRTAIAVGDVAGKGTGAALYGSLAIGLLRGGMAEGCSPGCALSFLNAELRQLAVERRFLALVYALYEHDGRRLSVANAGFPYPYLVRGGVVRELETGGVPLGALPDVDYAEVSLTLEPGDVVAFLSDGLEECRDPAGRQLGGERLARALGELAGGTSREIAKGLITLTEHHLGDRGEPSDDRTAVILKVVAD